MNLPHVKVAVGSEISKIFPKFHQSQIPRKLKKFSRFVGTPLCVCENPMGGCRLRGSRGEKILRAGRLIRLGWRALTFRGAGPHIESGIRTRRTPKHLRRMDRVKDATAGSGVATLAGSENVRSLGRKTTGSGKNIVVTDEGVKWVHETPDHTLQSVAGLFADGPLGVIRACVTAWQSGARGAVVKSLTRDPIKATELFLDFIVPLPTAKVGGGRKRVVSKAALSPSARKVAEGLPQELIDAFNIKLD